MQLTEDNYLETISSYDRKHWQPLLDLIPEIEATDKFEEIAGGEKDDKGVIQMPYYIESPIVEKFRETVVELGIIISFNWSKWDEGRKITSNSEFDFDSIDIPTKCKLITAIVRNDRFCEGVLFAAFESGLILKILQSIDRQLK